MTDPAGNEPKEENVAPEAETAPSHTSEPLVVLNASQMLLLFVGCALLGLLGSLINPGIAYVFVALAAAIVTFGFLGGVAQVQNQFGTFGGAVGVFIAVLIALFQFNPVNTEPGLADNPAVPTTKPPNSADTPKSTHSPAERESKPDTFSVLGKWQQEFFEEGRWNSGGVFEISTNSLGELQINAVQRVSGVQQSSRTFDMTIDGSKFKTEGEKMVFKSDWGTFGIGTFRLNRTNADLYEGSAFEEDGTEYRKNRFRRVKDD